MWPLTSRTSRPTNHTDRRRNAFRPRLEPLDDRSLPSSTALDPSFGLGGIETPLHAQNAPVSSTDALAVYPQAGTANDGKIVTGGTAMNVSARQETFAVFRYNLNGTPDTSFGGTGQVALKFSGSSVAGTDYTLAVQPDGKILAAGAPGLARFNTDGTLDTTFGTNGEVLLPFTAQAMSLEPDGQIVLANHPGGSNTLELVRYNANGTPDTSFGTGSIATLRFASGFTTTGMALEPGTGPTDPNAGKIVVSGTVNGVLTVVRFDTDGSPDNAFGGTGTGSATVSPSQVTPVEGFDSSQLAVQSDDRIVVEGEGVTPAGTANFALARLNPDGTADTTFGSGGHVDTALPVTAPSFPGTVTFQSNGQIVVAGTNNSSYLMVARYNADGGLDPTFGINGIGVATGLKVSAADMAVAVEPNGGIVVAGTSLSHFALARFLAAGVTDGPQIGSLIASASAVTPGAVVTFTAADIVALNPGATVTNVTFYLAMNDSDPTVEPATDPMLRSVSQGSNGNWSFNWSTTGLAKGTYKVFAVAQDSEGALSDPLSVTLEVT